MEVIEILHYSPYHVPHIPVSCFEADALQNEDRSAWFRRRLGVANDVRARTGADHLVLPLCLRGGEGGSTRYTSRAGRLSAILTSARPRSSSADQLPVCVQVGLAVRVASPALKSRSDCLPQSTQIQSSSYFSSCSGTLR